MEIYYNQLDDIIKKINIYYNNFNVVCFKDSGILKNKIFKSDLFISRLPARIDKNNLTIENFLLENGSGFIMFNEIFCIIKDYNITVFDVKCLNNFVYKTFDDNKIYVIINHSIYLFNILTNINKLIKKLPTKYKINNNLILYKNNKKFYIENYINNKIIELPEHIIFKFIINNNNNSYYFDFKKIGYSYENIIYLYTFINKKYIVKEFYNDIIKFLFLNHYIILLFSNIVKIYYIKNNYLIFVREFNHNIYKPINIVIKNFKLYIVNKDTIRGFYFISNL